MKEIDAYKFLNEIALFKRTLAPSEQQKAYLEDCKERIIDQILETVYKTDQSPERCLLVAICGKLDQNASKKQQAEFATRLLLLELLLEQE